LSKFQGIYELEQQLIIVRHLDGAAFDRWFYYPVSNLCG
jgi:hypothetical protein